MAQITEFLENLEPSSQPFKPYACYGQEEDAIKVFFSGEQDYAKRLNSRVTIYLSVETHKLVGIQIKNVYQVLEDIGSYDIAIKHGKVKVQMLFLAVHNEFSKQEETRKVFQELGVKASASQLELELPAPC